MSPLETLRLVLPIAFTFAGFVALSQTRAPRLPAEPGPRFAGYLVALTLLFVAGLLRWVVGPGGLVEWAFFGSVFQGIFNGAVAVVVAYRWSTYRKTQSA